MYASDVKLGADRSKQQKLTFFVSGQLWGRSLVMEDRETGSQWSHILGRAMAGPLEGRSLEIIPCLMTDWETWRTMHPTTTAVSLDKSALEFTREMMSRFDRFGLGLVHQGQARFWQFDRLSIKGIVQETWQELPLLIYFEDRTRIARAWSRRQQWNQDGEPARAANLDFEQTADGAVVDRQTNSRWDLRTGRATEGPLQGKRLTALPAIISFTSAWQRFHPDTSEWQPVSKP